MTRQAAPRSGARKLPEAGLAVLAFAVRALRHVGAALGVDVDPPVHGVAAPAAERTRPALDQAARGIGSTKAPGAEDELDVGTHGVTIAPCAAAPTTSAEAATALNMVGAIGFRKKTSLHVSPAVGFLVPAP